MKKILALVSFLVFAAALHNYGNDQHQHVFECEHDNNEIGCPVRSGHDCQREGGLGHAQKERL